MPTIYSLLASQKRIIPVVEFQIVVNGKELRIPRVIHAGAFVTEFRILPWVESDKTRTNASNLVLLFLWLYYIIFTKRSKQGNG